jgi:hypothetical protein
MKRLIGKYRTLQDISFNCRYHTYLRCCCERHLGCEEVVEIVLEGLCFISTAPDCGEIDAQYAYHEGEAYYNIFLHR